VTKVWLSRRAKGVHLLDSADWCVPDGAPRSGGGRRRRLQQRYVMLCGVWRWRENVPNQPEDLNERGVCSACLRSLQNNG